MVQVVTQTLTVTNTSAAPAHATWTSSDPAVAVTPHTAVVLAGAQSTFEAHIAGQAVGQLHALVTCSVQHGTSCAVSITAQVQGGFMHVTNCFRGCSILISFHFHAARILLLAWLSVLRVSAVWFSLRA